MGQGMGQVIFMIVIFGGMMFFFQRSQKKQQQKREESLNTMQPGSKVITIGGLHGVISEVNQTKKTVTIDCEGIYLEFERSAIRSIEPVSTESVAVSTEESDETTQNETTKEK